MQTGTDFYRHLVECSDDMSFILAPDGTINYISPSCTCVLGHPAGDMTGQPFLLYIHREDRPRYTEALRKLLDGSSPREAVECRARQADGSWRWLRTKFSAVSSGSNAPTHIACVSGDITELKRATSALASRTAALEEQKKRAREREIYLETILNTVQGAFIVVRRKRIVQVNEAFFQMFGYDRKDIETLDMMDLVAEEHLPDVCAMQEQLKHSGHAFFESVNRRKDGGKFQVEVSVAVFSREPYVTVVFIHDSTGKKNAEKELLRSQELMRYIIEHNRLSVSVFDKNMNYMYVSRSYLDMYNFKETDVIGKHHYGVIPQLPERIRAVHRRALQGEIIFNDNEVYPEADGKMHYSRWECRPWYEDDGSIGGLVVYLENVTEKKRIEQLLIDEKEHLRTTLLSVGDGVISTDSSGSVTMMNPVAERLTGWPSAEATGRRFSEVCRIVDERTGLPEAGNVERVLVTKQLIEYGSDSLVVSRTGAAVPVEVSAAPIQRNGIIGGAVIVIRDFTEKKTKQRQIEFLSYNDALTGLHNRRYVEDALMRLDTPENLPLSLVTIDVNGLKLTNDAFGHEMGDQLLKTVAGILKIIAGPDDIVGRMGGDEFCILSRNTDEEQTSALRQRILDEASHLKLDPVVVSLAIGYAVKSMPEQDIRTILKLSDDHMYHDKIKFGKIMRSQTIQMALQIINTNYGVEHLHTERVSCYCEAIGLALGFTEKEVADIKAAGALHDIGKIMVPSQVLSKPGRLTKEEFDLVKRHPEIGYQMLKTADEYMHLAEYVLYHHERWDGTGYPVGLRGGKIPLFSRIIAVADAFEAMTGLRPYQEMKSKKEAVDELERCAGSQFDTDIVKVFVEKVLK